jgi:peptide/nickel transport system permease protein
MSGSFRLFLLRRAAGVVVVSVAVAALTFVTLHGLTPESFPGSRSLPVELADYLQRAFLHADLGVSRGRPFQPVTTLIADAVPADLSVIVGALAFGLAGGIAAGAVCARRPGTLLSRALQGGATVLLCAPVYVIGMLVILIFGSSVGGPIPIGLVAPNTYVGLTHDPLTWLNALVVPWLVAGAPLAAMCLRMTRASLPEIVDADFVRTATAKGLSPLQVTTRHTLPVALSPTLSLAGAYVPLLVGNVVLVEAVFGIPGLYRLIPGAIDNGNFPVLQGIVIVGAVFVVVANAVVDVTLAALDPRIRRHSP